MVSTLVESRDVRNCRLFSRAASILTVLIGSLALLGWLLRIPALTNIFPGLATMKPNTALCFMLAGVSLWLIQLRSGELVNPRIRRIQAARILGGVVGLVGLLTLVEYLLHVNLGIDEAMFHRTLQATGFLHPGRMSGATALGFLLLGTGVMSMSNRRSYLAQGFALFASLVGFVACVGYLFGARALYDVPAYSSMAPLTAVLFVLLGLATVAAWPRHGLMAVVTSEYMGGVMARSVLPLVLVVPVLFGWLRWHGQISGLYGTEFGIALRTLSEVMTLTTMLWISARWFNRLDEERQQVKRRNHDLVAIVESSDAAMLSVDLAATITRWNQGAEKLFGYSAAEIIGKAITTLIPPERQEEATLFLREIARGRLVAGKETLRQRKDGSLVHVSLTVSPVRDLEGQIMGASVIMHDITERKQAEQLLRVSEENYRTLFNSMDEGFCTIEVLFNENNEPVDYRFLEVNPAFAKQTGIPDARGRRMREIAPQHEEHWFATYGKIALTGEPARFENVAAQLHRCYDVHAFRVGEPQEKKVAIFFDDITERKKAEVALREQAQVMDSAPVFVRDLENRIVFWPRGVEKLYGFRPDEALGVVSHDLLHTQFPEPLERIQKKLFAAGIWEGELIHHTRDGSTMVVSSVWTLHRNDQGKPLRILETNIDITPRKTAEDELDQSRKALEDKSLMLQSVLDSMSEGLVVADERGKFVIWNPAAEKIVGLGPANMPSQEWTAHYGLFLPDKVTPLPPEKNPLTRALQGEAGAAVMFVRHPELPDGAFVEAYASPLKDKHGVLRGGVTAFRDITERLRAEEKLRKSEERFSKAFRSSPLAITISTEAEGRYLDVNEAFLQVLGYKREDVIERTASDLNFWVEPAQRMEMLRQLRERGRATGIRTQYKTSTGEIREAEVSAERIEIEGQPCVLAITRDITETQRLEAQFRQAQKMEAVGRLAGGVAHDFNNMLGLIIGYSDLSLSLIPPGSPENRYLEQIKKASHRAVSLTRQLLAFSRQQVVFPKNLDLNEVVQNVTTMLQRLVGEDVAISFRPALPIGSISADPGQIEQILMNLVVNARDAMPGGGEIVIETGHAELDKHYVAQHPGSHAGQHVVLAVSDTGCGIDENIKSKIFEPFFTTKGIGQGTGLGLSTVYGIVKQSGGTIFVYSEPGRGTTFKIYFPKVAGKTEQLAQAHQEAEFPGGSETILVVEDDEPLRDLTVRMLQDAGYRIIEAKDAETALDIVKSADPGIDLLLTDVIMPRKSGPELLEQAKLFHPGLRSLFMSGYTGDLVALRGGLVPEAAFLEKPFTKSSLLKKVHSALHGESAEPESHDRRESE